MIARAEGWKALLKGSFARCCFHIPMTAITMGIVEQIRPIIYEH